MAAFFTMRSSRSNGFGDLFLCPSLSAIQHLSRDGCLVGNVAAELNHFTSPSNGKGHTYAVSAVYAGGESEATVCVKKQVFLFFLKYYFFFFFAV